MLRISFLILSVLVFNSPVHSQAEAVVEQYHFAGKGMPYLFMPVAHFQSARNWYAEARYNYEDIETFSLHFGKSFTGDKRLSYSLTPLLGASVGRYKGVSTGLNVDLEFEQFFFSAQSQYSMATARGKRGDNFFYSWSEAGYQPLNWLYAGASFQQTWTSYEKLLEPGMLVGFSFNRFSIPLYGFDLFDNNNRYFIIGLTVSWQGKKKEGSNKQTKPVQF
jgi:hypothetical protein